MNSWERVRKKTSGKNCLLIFSSYIILPFSHKCHLVAFRMRNKLSLFIFISMCICYNFFDDDKYQRHQWGASWQKFLSSLLDLSQPPMMMKVKCRCIIEVGEKKSFSGDIKVRKCWHLHRTHTFLILNLNLPWQSTWQCPAKNKAKMKRQKKFLSLLTFNENTILFHSFLNY